ncbi:GmrSD restriction endonuclease domain-containing protein [Enterococcus plantarum]|uniref:GmrSD restriction endonuclease domain-containing protein n=1 Tax=Enterococcus plantarum TaxID=1077675 RepID=UPI001A8E42BF|nr:DUF262 domain-containing protein [Enterococcus plantarum]
MGQEEIQKIVKVICLYYSKLESGDKRRSKITSKYRELEILTGINSNTIKQWTDTFDPYFKNSRKGYYQRNLEESNKSLLEIYEEYKDIDVDILEKKVANYLARLKGNVENEIVINDKIIHMYSVKTRDENIVKNIQNQETIIRINRLNWYKNEITCGDLVFLIFGGDRKPWKNGLVGISVVEEIIYMNEIDKNFEIDVRLIMKFPTELTPEDFYYYPNVKNVINIGPALKGTPNQAINKVPYVGALSIFGAIIEIFPELESNIRHFVGTDVFSKLFEIPRLQTRGEIEKEIVDDELNIDFEGSDDLVDYISLSDSEKNVINGDMPTSSEEIKKELMGQSSAAQKSKIVISREPLSVYDLYRKYKRFDDYSKKSEFITTNNIEDSLILEPPFQRDYVWNSKKKEELIESILLGIPLPTFYFSQDLNGNFLVVDGKQRLNAIFKFLDNSNFLDEKYSFLTVNRETDGKVSFNNLQSKIQRKIEDFSLNCYIIGASTPPIIQNEIFIRVNRGGVPLNQQEIRNASNVGMVTLNLLNVISERDDINIVPKKRKKDQYLALRFFALYLVLNDKKFGKIYSFYDEYQNMDNFLDMVMKYINNTSKEYVDDLYGLYVENIKKAEYVFDFGGMKKFTRSESNAVNMIIFEVWMIILSNFSINEVRKHKSVFINQYKKLINDDDFLNNILYLRDKKEKIIERLGFIEKYKSYIEGGIEND